MGEQNKAARAVKHTAFAHAPWEPAAWQPADAAAMQALMRGDCPSHLQKRALDFILWDLCGMRNLSFRPGGTEGERETSFAEGKRFVGLQIGQLLQVKVNPGGEQL